MGIFADGASAEGVLDLVGNVWEWCSDWYGGDTYRRRATRAVQNPTGPERGRTKVLRGGSWVSNHNRVRCAARLNINPALRSNDSGFPVARGPLG